MSRVMSVVSAAAAALVLTTAASSQIQVPPGFAVDTLVDGQIDKVTPRIEAVRNPAFGSGVIAASITSDLLTVRRVSVGGSLETIASTPATGFVLDVRFDTSGLFDGDLLVATSASNTTVVYRVTAGGTITPIVTAGSAGDPLAFLVEVSDGSAGYDAGAFLPDLNGVQGSSLWFLEPDLSLVQLAQDSVPAGRTDIDVRGLEFDRSPGQAFGGALLVVDNDSNQSQIAGVYTLAPDLSWSEFSVTLPSADRYLRDIAVGTGGPFGAFAYLVEAQQDVIERLEPDGTVTVFASGFDFSVQYDNEPGGAASLSVTEAGDALFVADDGGLYRIRLTGDDPGPVLIAREPSTPSGAHCDPGGLPQARLVWSEAISFTSADVTVTDGGGQPVGFTVSGSGTPFLLVSFSSPVFSDSYTITVADSAVSASSGLPIDGDDDGVAGGALVLTLTHRCPADLDGNGQIDGADLGLLLAAWGVCL